MGVTRLGLSLLVVGSHFGNLGEPIGGTAVASFFAISGFLMARTITENYSGVSGVLRFYANRTLRIVPPALVVLVLTALVMLVRQDQPFQITRGGEMMLPDTDLPQVWWSTFILRPDGYPTYLFSRAFLAPQAWSLIVEGVFYLLAPAIVAVAVRPVRPSLWLLAAASFALAVACTYMPDGNRWLRSPISSGWTFLIGVLAYQYACSASMPERPWLSRLPLAGIFALALGYVRLPAGMALFVAPFLTVAWLVLGQWATRRGGRTDTAFGNLAYGVFIGHFLSALVMLWMADALFRATGSFGPFGEHGVTERLWRTNFYVAALIGGALLYVGVERPVERLRSALRHGKPRPRFSAAISG